MRLRASMTVVAIAAGASAIAGCGGGDSSSSTAQRYPVPTIPANAPHPPKGASPVLRGLYFQFTPPKPDPRIKGSGAAIEAGKVACAGMTPLEVKEKYFLIAVQSGKLDPTSAEGKAIASIRKYAKNVTKDSSFPTGQLAADAYKATLPLRIASYGAQGCVYVLARRLEHQLAPKK
jgi:hypothetical protein